MEEGGLALLGAMAAVVIAYLTAAITTSRKLKGSTDYFDDMALEFLRSRFRQLPDDVPYETLGALAREIGCSPRGQGNLFFCLDGYQMRPEGIGPGAHGSSAFEERKKEPLQLP
jgi:hypothetical protein